MKLNFSSNEVRNIFAENDYAEYSQLMFDTAKGEEKYLQKMLIIKSERLCSLYLE